MSWRWTDLLEQGYLHSKSFLSEDEIDLLRKDYELVFERKTSPYAGRYDTRNVSRTLLAALGDKMRNVATALAAAVGIEADVVVAGYYFATKRANLDHWHQDHDSFYIYQQHRHFLNFWIPIIKPDPKRSNLCVIPFGDLKKRFPDHCGRFEGSGAKTLERRGAETIVHDQENGGGFLLPGDIEEIGVAPELEAGDLLLCRGDIIHRTQDAATNRVAVSVRMTRSKGTINKTKLLSGCAEKKRMIEEGAIYQYLKLVFDEAGVDEMTVAQLMDFGRR
jgi:phytanoyl-CoA dioxygenase PhyH